MFDVATTPALQPLVLFAGLLVLKMGAVAFVTANERRKGLRVVNPEDARLNPGSVPAELESPGTLRAKRAHANDVENIPGFLVLAMLFVATGCSEREAWIYFGTYFAARTLHTVFYLNAVQPGRTLMFFVGQLTQLGIIVQLLLAVF